MFTQESTAKREGINLEPIFNIRKSGKHYLTFTEHLLCPQRLLLESTSSV